MRHINDATTPATVTPAKNKLAITCSFSLLTKLLPLSLEKLSSPMLYATQTWATDKQNYISSSSEGTSSCTQSGV